MQETQDGQVLEAPESSQRQDPTTSRHQKRADLEPRQERSRSDGPSRAEMANAMRENLDKNTNVVQTTVIDTQHVQALPKCDAQGFIPSLCTSSLKLRSDFRAITTRVFVWRRSRLYL